MYTSCHSSNQITAGPLQIWAKSAILCSFILYTEHCDVQFNVLYWVEVWISVTCFFGERLDNMNMCPGDGANRMLGHWFFHPVVSRSYLVSCYLACYRIICNILVIVTTLVLDRKRLHLQPCPVQKALQSFVLPVHPLNGTHTQSMSQLSQGLKILL